MRNYAKGKYTVKNPEKYIGNRQPTYRSSWEFAFMNFCDTNPNILKWASESIKINYVNPFSGRPTIYVPDFFIVYIDADGKQHSELIEIKPEKHTFKERVTKNQNDRLEFALNQVKWAAARAWASKSGINFRIINEGDMFHGTPRRRK